MGREAAQRLPTFLENTPVEVIYRILSTGNNLTFNQVEISGTAYSLDIHFMLNINVAHIIGLSTRLIARKELILSAGVINIPQLLMNSGIGDSDTLKLLGIPALLNLPSVGENLTDQPFAEILFSVNSNNTLDKREFRLFYYGHI